MKTKVIVTKFVPGGGIVAITLFGLVFTRERRFVTPRVLSHELIHCRQQLELLYLPFFLLYFIEWLCRLVRYGNADKAYRNLSFEREAYCNDHDDHYLSHRRPYAWMHYLRNKRPTA